jgi:K+-transporting ATPase c subunit
MKHLRASGLLFALTLAICCVAYPAVLWLVGRAAFPHQAQGDLLATKDW